MLTSRTANHPGSHTGYRLAVAGLLAGTTLFGIGSATVSAQSSVPAQVGLPADTVVIKGGRELPGKVVAPEEKVEVDGKSKTLVELETAAGGKFRLERGKVVSGVKASADEFAAYREFAAGLADDVAAHWQAIEWCQTQPSGKLKYADQITFHLRRIVALDESDAKAQKALGNENINGRWVNEELHNRARGYTRAGGKWRSQTANQMSEVLDAGKSSLGDTKEGFTKWKRTIAKMSEAEVNNQRVPAVRDLAALITPTSIAFVSEQFDSEKRESVQEVYLEAIALQKNRFAMGKLVDVALTHASPTIRERALAYLKQFDRDEAALQALSYLDSPDNAVVANAGALLGEMESPRAILALIKHLKTRHVVKNPNSKQSGQGGMAIDTGFGNAGGGGLNLGGSGPATVNALVENKDVENALKRITRLNLGNNEADWMRWYLENHTLNQINLRADD